MSDRKRDLVRELRPSEEKSHSGSFADMTIAGADVAKTQLRVMAEGDNLECNHATLLDAGWDGERCIGPISCTEAITRLQKKQPLACRKKIPKLRRDAIPKAYRCAQCQTTKEGHGKPVTRR